ncbi:hypothetical protein XA68_10841 [Ophiocordyceps unilateralis]|uniref:Exocyst complex protein EXO70 n=1 Tax=Ophiocordyceps unilateralis TaxID=268505 RepID=A0A2A9NY62_OPHUN|nr:hypothetical protein XA68_10841 [Ophiocordyceps unilateralis]
MALDLSIAAHQVVDEEARAEVDVLNSRLEQTSQLTRKIRACLVRLEASSQTVSEVSGPLNGDTKRLQRLENNVDAVLAAIERLRQPADSKDNEQHVIRAGPEKAGLPSYFSSLSRLLLSQRQKPTVRANQHSMNDLARLIKEGNSHLKSYFERLLQDETPRSIEPLHFVTKEKPFPVLPEDKATSLGDINTHIADQSDNISPVSNIYASIRGPYLSLSLANLAAASVTTAKKKNPGAMYRSGTNGIGTYAKAMEGLLLSEYDNICRIFHDDDRGRIFRSTCQATLTELEKTIGELNAHIKAYLGTDCYLAYEIIEILSSLSDRISKRTGELKTSVSRALKPIRETAKSSLSGLLEDTKRKTGTLQALALDGTPTPVVSETMHRLQAMVEFLRPISSIMISLGDGGWKQCASSSGWSADTIPSLASFDIGADGRDIFVHYCLDTIDTLLSSLEQKARNVFRSKAAIGVFLANCTFVIERMVRDSELEPVLGQRLTILEQWRKKATGLYTDMCKDLSIYLFDSIHTNRSQRPASGQADSASVVKGLSGKDKDKIKEKFLQFNSAFDDMVTKHKSFYMEQEVRTMFGDDIRQKLQPLYERFWDR